MAAPRSPKAIELWKSRSSKKRKFEEDLTSSTANSFHSGDWLSDDLLSEDWLCSFLSTTEETSKEDLFGNSIASEVDIEFEKVQLPDVVQAMSLKTDSTPWIELTEGNGIFENGYILNIDDKACVEDLAIKEDTSIYPLPSDRIIFTSRSTSNSDVDTIDTSSIFDSSSNDSPQLKTPSLADTLELKPHACDQCPQRYARKGDLR